MPHFAKLFVAIYSMYFSMLFDSQLVPYSWLWILPQVVETFCKCLHILLAAYSAHSQSVDIFVPFQCASIHFLQFLQSLHQILFAAHTMHWWLHSNPHSFSSIDTANPLLPSP